MKLLITVSLALSLSACATTSETTLADGSPGIVIHCPGMLGTWSDCYEKANKACSAGWDIVERESFMIDKDLQIRNLQVQCK